ncbi:MAG TPA: M23 family metallopeptidase [Anaerolineales bacterium]|nr:M23 family metallopeptidase [Anaerolineales bacterium]
MEHQIILLPRTDYWVWLQACRDYVLKFGASLTDDPGTAARFMAPRQVITFPSQKGAFPELGDAERWFQSQYPGIRLDVVEANKPKRMRKELQQRVADNDRYGARRRPFYLLWPTDYPVVTQTYGANPQIYRRFALPGHEGLDFRALTNTNVYACADGEVYEVHPGARDHAYGVHVRIQHRDGYKTVYAHLARALVRKGDRVEAGQIVGKADSTGNSSASHLHLTLKRDGATARRETKYPKDIIDPTPYLVWPAQSWIKRAPEAKGEGEPIWEAGRCLVGVRGTSASKMGQAELEAVRLGRAEAVLLAPDVDEETIAALRAIRPGMFMLARLTIDTARETHSPQAAAKEFEPIVRRLVAAGVREFEIHSEPNLVFGGLGHLWKDGAAFARWFLDIVHSLRASVPEARFGFPMLSPGESIQGKRQSMISFLAEAEEAVLEADWIGVGCFWSSTEAMDLPSEGRAYEHYRAHFPEKLLMVTGLGPAFPGLSEAEVSREVLSFVDRLRDEPRIAAAFAGTVTPGDEAEALAWVSSAGEPTAMARAFGRRKA